MSFRRSLLVAFLALATATGAQAGVGDTLPDVDLEGFTQTKASSLDDYIGRTVLIEFFAYW